MLDQLDVHRARSSRALRQPWQLAAREVIHEPGAWGRSWRLVEGAIRLDRVIGHGERSSFVHLALPGQLIGAEMLLKGQYVFRAQTVVPSVLMPWPTLPDEDVTQDLLAAFSQQYCEQADQMQLCHGTAESRLAHMLIMLTRHMHPDADGGRVMTMPGLRDLADITDLTMETVSRCITRLRVAHTLDDLGRRQFRFWPERLGLEPAALT